MSDTPLLGIIGGTGLYHMEGLMDVKARQVETPFGEPSSPLFFGTLEGKLIVFIARHGIGHRILPSEVNYRANIYALKSVGVSRVVSVSAAGSLREDYKPGDMVIPDQLMDFTRQRKLTFFGEGLVAHIGSAEPFCNDLSERLYQAVQSAGVPVHQGGAFITIEGPRFSTRVESNLYRSWGMSLIGMTTSPEAFLAREAEMCYAVLAHITDYDVWHISEEPVSVEMIIEILNRNPKVAQEALRQLVRNLPETYTCECQQALKNAIVTKADLIPQTTLKNLEPLVGKYLSSGRSETKLKE